LTYIREVARDWINGHVCRVSRFILAPDKEGYTGGSVVFFGNSLQPRRTFRDPDEFTVGRLKVEPMDWKLEFQLQLRGGYECGTSGLPPLIAECASIIGPERQSHLQFKNLFQTVSGSGISKPKDHD
jgi:hypothetical protein